MERKSNFCRALSAILILFGGTFSWAVGACDISKYDCQDLSGYDNSHPVLSSIKPGVQFPNEIPNDGKISKTSGSVFEDKRQIINFSNIPILDIQNQKDSLKASFGGENTWVFGDIVTAGNPIMTSMKKGNPGDQEGLLGHGDNRYWVGAYINDGDIEGNDIFNSSEDEIKLPKGVTKDDIVFAKLYWFGQVYTNEGLPNSWDSNGILEVKDIAGYQDVKLRIEDKTYDIKRDSCQGIFAYNSERATTGISPYKDNKKRYNLNYTCSTDITEKVKENFEDFENEIEIAVGNITATPYSARLGDKDNGRIYPSNQIYRIADATKAGNIDGGFKGRAGTENAPLLPFGGWYVVLVYDKSIRSQAELRGLDFPDDTPDAVKFTKAKDAEIGDNAKTVKQYIENTFKPKNITIYDGYLSLEPPSSGATAINTDFELSGFFTPKSGTVQGKMIVGSFGSNYGITNNKEEGIFVSKEASQLGTDASRLQLDPNYHTDDIARRNTFFNGTRSRLIVKDDGAYKFDDDLKVSKKSYYQGYDLDEFDISNRLEYGQSNLSVRISEVTLNGGSNRAMVPFLGVSIDIYVPNLCYEEKMYDTAGWLGFYNEDGTPKNNPGKVEDVSVVTGENLYYRTEFRNQKDKNGGGEDADFVYVKVNFGNSNTYVRDSSGIDNRLVVTHEPDGTDRTDDAKFVYLLDNKAGAYTTQAKRSDGGTPDAGDPYGTGQFNSLVNDEFKFYIGRDAGKPSPQGPLGGTMRPGDSAYVEFNATIGRTFTYNPIRYTAGYKMSPGGDKKAIDGPNTIMERCKSTAKTVEINLLNGLKVVNQNYKDYCDGKYVGSFASADYKCGSATDVNKTKSQDDRLYTQVAELPFDVNLIFKPDINDVFRYDCASYGADGKCLDYGENVCKNFGGIFEMNNGACVPINGYVKLPDGTWGIKYKEGKLDGSLQRFILPGKLYLSAIRAGSGCKYIDNRAKIPFIVDGKRYMTNYDTDFINYQQTKQELIKPIAKVAFEDAFNGVTFMFSYYPRGIEKPDMNTTIYVGDWNSTQAYNYDRTTKTWTEVNLDNSEEYYIWVQTQMLYEKYIRGYKLNLAEDEKRRLVENWFDNPDNVDKIADFDKELKDIEDEIMNARTFFGVEMSPDGSFHVCDSEKFVVRPAHFRVNMDAATKYAKLIDANATGDITQAVTTRHDKNYRLGGDYTENTDILGSMFYAESIKGHAVPNYNQLIGGNLGKSRFIIRTSYNNSSLDNALEGNIDMFRENKTYLKPFISNECYASIENQAFFTEENINNRSDKLYLTKNYSCANDQPAQYNGFELENGQYKLIVNDVSKERNNTDRQEIGKITIDESCKVEGHIFGSYYEKVWDKDANNLFANFGVKKVNINDGYAEIQRFSPNELMAQALLEPNHKEVVAAALYTGMLLDKTSKDKLGAIFNYFNVGDVLVKVYDNSWTDNYGNQTFDKRVGPDGEHWGSTCILNSTSNTPNEFGKVGCDVGMENNQELVLRFKPDRINLAVEGLGISSSRDKSSINPADNFVYYNSPDIESENALINGFTNKAMINRLDELGVIRFNGETFLSDKIYKDTIATLYDGRILEGTFKDETYDVATCGFANDLNVTVQFNFDCNTNADSRCATNIQTTDIRTTDADISYAPYPDLPSINYTIPAGTPFLSIDSQCANNNGASDSRCFTYNIKTATFNAVGGLNSMNEADRSSALNYRLPLPINLAINYYTSANKDRGFINDLNTTNNIYDPKSPLFTLLARAFNQGTTNNASIFINFDRMQKSPHFPLYILADDFNIISLSNNGQIEPAKFNSANILVNQNGDPLINSTDKDKHEFTDKPYKDEDDRYESFDISGMGHNTIDFQNHIRAKKALTGLDSRGYLNSINAVPSILFVYGKANEVNNGELVVNANGIAATTYLANIVASPTAVDILDAIYCGRNNKNGCRIFPTVIVDGEDMTPVSNIFSGLATVPNNGGFITNITAPSLGSGTTPTVQDWVRNYIPKSNKLGVNRNNPNLQQGQETILLVASDIKGTDGPVEVEVLTWPWLIYTPHINAVKIDSDPANNMGTPIQFYNYFSFAYISNRGQWGGEGEVKNAEKEGDIGSFITGKDFEDIAEGENANEQSPTIRNDRIDW